MSQINIMALRHSAFYTPLLMTIAGGFLNELGLDPTYTVATPDNTVVDNINNGICNLAQSAIATSFAELEQGKDVNIVHFSQINARDGFFITARERDTNFSWDKLIGKKILVDHFFQPYAMLKYGLSKQGIDINELDIIDAGNADQIDTAFRTGTADYVHQQGPAPQQLEKERLGYVVAAVGNIVGPVAFSSLCATREWVKTEMAAAFMQAYCQSLNYIQQADAEEIAVRELEAGFFPNINQEVLVQTITAYQNLGCWENDPVISTSSYENLLDVFMDSGLVTKRHAYDKAIVAPPEIN
ncbi:MAG: ABC transporter substrate-binding protein [Gammaproteobacteria bacterium]|nr:ABC transporter substrate-binding protein [Gammaproteobacteria bacterium]